MAKITREILEEVYFKYNHREYVHPDPLEFLYNYSTCQDKEIVGLIASSLAYGNVKQILKAVEKVLSPMGNSPSAFIQTSSLPDMEKIYGDFKHRFTTGQEIIELLNGIRKILNEYGSLRAFISKTFSETSDLLKTQSILVKTLVSHSTSLLPDVEKGSACKRLNLYFRWMVRQDEVDPGCWHGAIPTSELIIPLDTHMHQFSLKFGLTKRKSADLKTALEITEWFRRINPEDPTKYDFAITRAGIGKWYEW